MSSRIWQKGEKIAALNGTLAYLTEEDERALMRNKKDFSVMLSSR